MTLSTSALDPKIPFLADALDLHQAQTQLQPIFPNLREVTAATLIRHKPGRRALIKYQLDTSAGPLTLLGKIRAKGTDWNSYKIQQALWNGGWAADRPDGFSVPEPLGVIPKWHMGLQRQVPGIPATDVLLTDAGIPLARRIAALAHKLHHTPIPTPKTHTLTDELRILHDRLPLVADQHPHWRSRLTTLLQTCDTLAHSPTHRLHLPTYPIHRDFYPDQILVDRDRLWLIDLDLCCQGDPAIDIGNFIAHITEQSLRQTGDPTAMGDQEAAFREAFMRAWLSAGADKHTVEINQLHRAIELYTVLSLVRHIHISNRIPARRHLTAAILTLCETRSQQLRQEISH
ncbi:phosphotransferase [Halomicronema sp. CCY15110]|uniref:phosphotransferase n=1 Tax=Halomicronema sp. CCY15110 TaxID=2767773 RepID=UPI001951D372|nr:phosphotransferase [Halomicronema sp. CCY15110]